MHAIADTTTLVSDNIITPEQAREIEGRSRQVMVTLAINTILSFGIFAATAGLIFWLADALAVALFGLVMLGIGMAILLRTGQLYRMFGNAAALIGAGMLIAGSAFELLSKHDQIAGPIMTIGGLAVMAVFFVAFQKARASAAFVTGAILLMGFALHIAGLGFWLQEADAPGWSKSLYFLYAAAALAGLGYLTDVRLVTALAIVPFAQLLDTSTGYFHAVYVFYSPESALSILQMTVLMVICLLIVRHRPERIGRHARILAILTFITANLCALVGSLWGDYVGETLWGPKLADFSGDDRWAQFDAARTAFRDSVLYISADAFSIFWAVALVVMIIYAAWRAHRGLFNTALTFAAIHAYTQFFESFGDQPFAYVVGGLAAIPLAWGIWRLDGWLTAQKAAS
jgi:hypothetical protein